MSGRQNPDRVFARWWADFRAQAEADDCQELQRHLDYLGIKSTRQAFLHGTEELLSVIMAYREMDGQGSKDLLSQQRYRLAGADLPLYCLTFSICGRGFGRVLVDEGLTGVDFADLYGHIWYAYERVGFDQVWISRLDGESIDEIEPAGLEKRILNDLYFDIEEDEINVHLYTQELDDTAILIVQDREEEVD